MRALEFTTNFKRDYKLCKKQGKDMCKLQTVLEILQSGESIPAEYKDHPLSGNQKGFRDLHIEPDWVLIYKEVGDIIVVLAATGSHSHLFK
jgi:mRNA interferase YafQ